jgi:pimeloyl-ACP methyl ester carboxylesterase
MATFVLIHGAWHGGWCWDKVVPLLQAAGHTAVAPDLPGHGADQTPIAEVTLQAYADRVCGVLAEQREPAILVGHSLGGIVISQAAEQCPERVRTLVYLAAALVPNGRSTLAIMTDEPPPLTQYLQANDEEGYLSLADEGIQPSFYHDCSADDVAFAKARLTPRQAAAPFATPLALSAERFGRVPRVYIECLHDRAVPPAVQRQMYTAMPCAQVISLETSHSPFLAAPELLAKALAALA